MEKEIEKFLNSVYYLTIKVEFIDFGKYRIKIDEIDKWITYKFDYSKFDKNGNFENIEKIIANEIINYYRREIKNDRIKS